MFCLDRRTYVFLRGALLHIREDVNLLDLQEDAFDQSEMVSFNCSVY